ncbi:hypothetical protein U0070_009226 [Myodes glareolus]|uniref:Uncharacterized protein n=1 Tax=Myodes glareolus TaxID=447135 RepID=A0AAW0IR83_MYOGA
MRKFTAYTSVSHRLAQTEAVPGHLSRPQGPRIGWDHFRYHANITTSLRNKSCSAPVSLKFAESKGALDWSGTPELGVACVAAISKLGRFRLEDCPTFKDGMGYVGYVGYVQPESSSKPGCDSLRHRALGQGSHSSGPSFKRGRVPGATVKGEDRLLQAVL